MFWEPPDVGPAPTGVWRVPPHAPLQLEDPSLKPKPFPPRPLPPSPSHPLGSFCNAPGVRDGAAQTGVGGGVPKGVEGEGPPAVLGARPTSGGTRMFSWRMVINIASSPCEISEF